MSRGIKHWQKSQRPRETLLEKNAYSMILGTFRFPTAEERIAESFNAFVVQKNYFNADQTRFLRVVKSVFLEKARRKEALALADLYEEPFDTFGIDAADRLFRREDMEEIVGFFNRLRVA